LSFKSYADLGNRQFLPTTFVWDNYETILVGDAQTLFLSALRNSIGICLIATFIAVVLSTFCAYAIARLDFPGKRIILTTALAVAIFPVISIVTPLFNLWRNIGLYDTWPGVIIPYLSLTLPISIWTLSAFFRQIPWELEKAAKMDGATQAQAFRRVIAPLAAPGVVTTAILVFIFCWNDFLFAVSLTSTEASRTAPVALSFFTGDTQFEDPTGSISAAAVVITIPIIIFVLLFQRRIVSGLTSGAVKG
jgi:multiple sugar transport system permease protein